MRKRISSLLAVSIAVLLVLGAGLQGMALAQDIESQLTEETSVEVGSGDNGAGSSTGQESEEPRDESENPEEAAPNDTEEPNESLGPEEPEEVGSEDPETPGAEGSQEPGTEDPDDPGNLPAPEEPDEPGEPEEPDAEDPKAPDDPGEDPDDPGNLPGPEDPGSEPGDQEDPPGFEDPVQPEEPPVDPNDPGNLPRPEEPVEPEEPEEVDTSALQVAVDAALELEGNYTEESWGAFADALSDAQAVLADEESTQEEADSTLAALNAAIAGLMEAEQLPEEQQAEPAVDVVITADQMAYALGDTVRFTVDVENNGNVDLAGLLVEDTLCGLSQTIALAVNSAERIYCTYVIPLDYDQSQLTNSVSVSGVYVQEEHDSIPVSARSTVTVDVIIPPPVQPGLTVSIKTDQDRYQPGETVYFTVTVANSGQVDLADLTVQDTLTGLDETIAQLAVGAETVFRAKFLIPGEFPPATFSNSVSVEGEYQGQEVWAEAQVAIEVIPAQLAYPALAVKLKADKEEYQLGETVYYTVTVTNIGNMDLENVVAQVKSSLGSMEERIGFLAMGEEKTFSGEFQLNQDYEDTTVEIKVDVSGYWNGFGASLQYGDIRGSQTDSILGDEPGMVVVAGDMITLSVDSKLYEYGQPPLPDNGGTQNPNEPSEPRTLPPIPPGGNYPDTVVVNKSAAEAAGCRTYEVTLDISGNPNVSDVRPIDLVVLIDVSGSMDEGAPSVWTKGKQYAVTFAQDVAGRADSEVAIVTFAHNMSNKGEGVPDRDKPGSTADDTYLKQEFTNKSGQIQSGINNINVYSSGSNIEAGFTKALDIVNRPGRSNTHKIIVLFTDGLANISNGTLPGPDWPTYHNSHTAAAITAGQAAWETARVYSIGLFKEIPSESYAVAQETLDWASNAGFYEAVTEADMERILDEIYTQIIPIATDAVVTDKIPVNFDLVPGSFSKPGVSYDSETRIITWDVGIIGTGTTLTYKIKANASNSGGAELPTNDWAYLNYTDVNGDSAQKDFPVPTVYVPPRLTVNAGPDREVTLGSSIGIGDNLVVSGGYTPYSYRWTCAADPNWSSTEQNPSVSPTEDTVYTITVTDKRGCTASDTVAVTILKGAITITKRVLNGSTIKTFPIYVEGNGYTWSMLLADDESATIRGLEPGTYGIREVVPMDYRLVSISPSTVTITPSTLNVDVTVTNRKVNDSWFRDEDEVVNSFTVGFWVVPEAVVPEADPQGEPQERASVPEQPEAVLSPEQREEGLEESETPEEM